MLFYTLLSMDVSGEVYLNAMAIGTASTLV